MVKERDWTKTPDLKIQTTNSIKTSKVTLSTSLHSINALIANCHTLEDWEIASKKPDKKTNLSQKN